MLRAGWRSQGNTEHLISYLFVFLPYGCNGRPCPLAFADCLFLHVLYLIDPEFFTKMLNSSPWSSLLRGSLFLQQSQSRSVEMFFFTPLNRNGWLNSIQTRIQIFFMKMWTEMEWSSTVTNPAFYFVVKVNQEIWLVNLSKHILWFVFLSTSF